MPARLSKIKYLGVFNLKRAHRALGCRGVTRSDFKFYKNKFSFRVNTQPGMTNLSLVHEIASYYNINFNDLVETILLDASLNR